MKDKFLLLGILSMLFGMTSCSDNESPITTVEPGTEINFGSVLQPTSDTGTRSYYGEPVVTGGNKVWPIFWNPSPDNDHIFIYSPQALADRNQATYKVTRNEDAPKEAANITKVGTPYGVQAGNADTYDFYGLYPASAVTDPATGTTVNGNLPGNQQALFTGTTPQQNMPVPVVTVAPKPQGGTIEYYMKPDMSACLMTAEEKNITLQADKAVNMVFKPFATCIDITVNGPETNTTTGQTTAWITEVIVTSSTGNLSGDFSYDFSTGNVNVTNGSKTISIDTKMMDADGDITGIPLMSGNKLHLQAFILPTADIKDLTVQIVTSNFKTYSKKLVVTNLGKGEINPVELPQINLAEGTIDYSIWLSQLDPRIYVSEVSLPGASAAFSAVLNNGDLNKMQTKSLTDLFNAGIRVFQSHINLINQTSTIDNGPTSIGISVNGNSVAYGGRFLTLSDVINELINQMSNAHSDEFCVLLLSDYGVDDNHYATFFSRLKTILDSDVMQKLVVTDFSPNTTIGDIKGKVLLKYAVNNEHIEEAKNLTGTNALFNLWDTKNSSTQLNYSNLLWKSATGLTNNKNYTAPATNQMLLIHSEQANPLKTGIWDSNVKDQISAYHQRYDSSTHNIFGMSYLGGAGREYTWPISDRTPTDVADHYNDVWTNAVKNYNDKPFGWVVVNMVGIQSSNNVIQKVIEQNVNKFKLNRDRRAKPSAAPAGDSKGADHGGSLF